MDPNKIAAMLRNLPDQQLAPLAQGASPHVNPQEAQMEMMRRAQTRKSAQVRGSGIKGLAEGGLVRFGRMSDEYLNEQEKKLAEAKRKRGEQMKPNSDAFRERAGQVVSDVGDMAKAGLLALVPDAIEDNFARQQALRDPASAEAAKKNRAYEEVMMQAEQLPEPTGILAQNAGAVTPPVAAPAPVAKPPAPRIGAAPAASPTSAAITTLAPPQSPAAPANTPTIGQSEPVDPFADFDTKLAEKVQEQMKPFQQIFAARAQALESGKRDPLDMDAKKKERFYEGLMQFGLSLLASNAGTRAQRMGGAFGDGVKVFMEGVKQDAALQEEVRKESIDIALKVQDNMLAEMGMSVQLRDKFGKELMDQVKERRAIAKDKSDAEYKQGQLDVAKEGLEAQREGNRLQYKAALARGNGEGSKEKDRAGLRDKAYAEALEMYSAPQFNSMPAEEKKRLIREYADDRVGYALGENPASAAPSLEQMLKAELARRAKQ